MLRTLRRQLRLIGYYSAPRKRTRSSVLFERAVVAALIGCIPAAIIADRSIQRVNASFNVQGYLVQAKDGTFIASMSDGQPDKRGPIFTRGAPIAGIDLELATWNNGWPVTSSRTQAPAKATFDRYDLGGDTSQPLIDEPGVREAIELAMQIQAPQLGAIPFDAVQFSWSQGERSHSPVGWIYACIAWFFLLVAACFAPLAVYEFTGRVLDEFRRRRSVSRQARGLCTFCGYNLMGNEFSERCPECGELVV